MLKIPTNLNNSLRFFLLVILSCHLASCTVGPNYSPAKINPPAKWHATRHLPQPVNTNNKPVKEAWWKSFHDPVLNQLIIQGMANNLDLKAAKARILASRATKANDFAKLFPQLEADGVVGRSSPGFIIYNKQFGIKQGTFDARWELDLFGEQRRAIEADQGFLDARVEAHNDILLSLLAEIASNYIEVRTNQKLLEISYKNVHAASINVNLSRSLRKGGVLNELEVTQARSQAERLQAEIPQYRIALAIAKNRLTTLLGIHPGELDSLLTTKNPKLPQFNEQILLSLPINVINQRPDVRKAERELAARTALIGNAIAKLFPTISLGAFYGRQSTTLISPATVWGIAPNLYIPLLNFGRIRSQINLAKANEREAYFLYKSTILQALEEVENKIASYYGTQQRERYLIRLDSARELALTLARVRYKKGISSYIDVMHEEITHYENQITLVQVQQEKLKNLIAVYNALGCNYA